MEDLRRICGRSVTYLRSALSKTEKFRQKWVKGFSFEVTNYIENTLLINSRKSVVANKVLERNWHQR